MAGKNGTENGIDNGKVITTAGGLDSEKNSGTGTTENGRTGKSGGRNNNSGAGTDTKKEGLSGLAVLSESETPTEIPKPELKKPRKPRITKKKNTKKNDEVFNAEQLTAFFMTVSSIASMSERGRIFALTEVEARQLSQPLSRIIANNDSMKALTEHSDSVALSMTAFMIFVPKIFMWLQYEKAHRKPKDVQLKIAKGIKKDERKTDNSNRNPNEGTSASVPNDSESVLASIPSVM